MHQESTYKLRDGVAKVTIDQGKISKIDGSKITIERLDGERVSATAIDGTKVCKDGEPSTVSALKVGDMARLMQVRSPKFNGLRRVAAFTPRAGEPTASPSDFSGDEFDELSGETF